MTDWRKDVCGKDFMIICSKKICLFTCVIKLVFNQHFHILHKTDQYTTSCPPSQTFSYKLQKCQMTCTSLSSEQQSCTSDFVPVDGCSCPEGLYLDDNGICVPMAKCPCYYNGAHIKPGKSINVKEEHWSVTAVILVTYDFENV